MLVIVNKPANNSEKEIEQFIGIVIFTLLVHLLATRMYWSFQVNQR